MKEANILDIEAKALNYLLELRKDKGMTEAELGKQAFPESSNPWSKVHAMWNAKTAEKKALRLRLGDFCAMCSAMGKDPAEALFTLWRGSEKD